jgi:hypothetical protein
MRNKLLLFTSVALIVAGCKLLEPLPTKPPADCSQPGGEAPKPPPLQSIPDTGTVPSLPPSTHIVVGLCPSTSAYTAMGVDTQTKSFTFLIKGGRASQQQAFNQFYAARVPVTVYTQRVQLRGNTPAPSPAPEQPPPAPVPTAVPQQGQSGSSSDPNYDPCENIGDEPPEPGPKPGGSQWEPNQFTAFQNLSWQTAFALDAVSDPASATTFPGPEAR